MTLPIELHLKCAVCGQEHDTLGLASTNMLEPPDLDTRPGEMMRSTMSYWLQRCPSCGYVSPNIEKCSVEIAEIVRSDPYQHQLNHPDYPELANEFLAWSYLSEQAGKMADAGWASLHAAWICDDKNQEKAAERCRLRAIEFFEQAGNHGQSFSRGKGDELAIFADLYRRTSQFEKAREVCEKGLRRRLKKLIKSILQYQLELIAAKDTKAHKQKEDEGATIIINE